MKKDDISIGNIVVIYKEYIGNYSFGKVISFTKTGNPRIHIINTDRVFDEERSNPGRVYSYLEMKDENNYITTKPVSYLYSKKFEKFKNKDYSFKQIYDPNEQYSYSLPG